MKTVDSGSITYIYGQNGLLISEADEQGQITTEYINLNGQPIGMVTREVTPGEPPVPEEHIVDNGDPGTSFEGTWAEKTNRKDYGTSYLLADGGTGSTYTWTPTINGGEYEVYAWWISSKKYSNAVDYVVTHAGQQSQVTVDQTSGGGQWNLLGQFSFTGDGSETIQVSDTNGKTVADAVRLVRITQAPPPQVTESSWYVHTDHLGTPQRVSNDTGQTVWKVSQSPFGKSIPDPDVDGDGVEVEMNLRFPGQYFDSETGLHYNMNRYYDPRTGRYLTSDPIGLDGGLNTYSYAINNPIIYIDPLGLACRQTRRGLRCTPRSGQTGGRVGIFGCLIGCVSYTQGDVEAQASMSTTFGGGIMLCQPKREEQSCKTEEPAQEKDCGIYDPNCDNKLLFSPSVAELAKNGRIGVGLGFLRNPDGSSCVLVGPFISPAPITYHLGNISE